MPIRATIKLTLVMYIAALFSLCQMPVEPQPEFLHQPVKFLAASVNLNDVPDVVFEDFATIKNQLGGKAYKLAFGRAGKLYILDHTGVEPILHDISRGDESFTGGNGRPKDPIFSADGKFIAYTGTYGAKTVSFIMNISDLSHDSWRLPIAQQGIVTSEPHWYIDDTGRRWLYISDNNSVVKIDSLTHRLSGKTYRTELINDSTLSALELTDLPGAFRGGISKDGCWFFTSYTNSVLFNACTDTHIPFVYGGRTVQNCNPSMNPFPRGSLRCDYVMHLGFGNRGEIDLPIEQNSIVTVADSVIVELVPHEFIYIYNRNKRVIWQGLRPDDQIYKTWEVPEWSTHPSYATAVALRTGSFNGNLYIINIGDLTHNDETELRFPQGYIKVGNGFSQTDWSHLWIEE